MDRFLRTLRGSLAILALVCATSVGRAAGPLFVEVDLSVGEEKEVKLADGTLTRVRLVAVKETQDDIRRAVRQARVTLAVDGKEATLSAAPYQLPVPVGKVQVDCPVTRGTVLGSRTDVWGLTKEARLRLWPAGSPWFGPGQFTYPARQRWFASDTQMANEPTFVDGGERPGAGKNIYYHYGLDIGGCEGMVDVVAATDGIVASAGKEVAAGHKGTPVAPRYDVVYLQDDRGWYYRYSHLKVIAPEVRPGAKVRRGQKIGVLGKEGSSGGWAHLHFDIHRRDDSGRWRLVEGYAFLWEAYLREHRPTLLAVARPHYLTRPGQVVTLDGSRSWGKVRRHDWKFTDGGTASGARVERKYDRPGSYSEVLKVTDADGRVAYDFAVVQVVDPDRPIPPTIHASYAPTFDIKAGDPVTFKVRTFRTVEGTETIDFGDGSPTETVRSDGGVKQHAPDGYAVARHRYAKPGDYIVRIERANKAGQRAVAHLWVQVGPRDAEGQSALENAHVRIVVDPARGGTVTSMVHKKAVSFPLIADRVAGVAGDGALFTLAVTAGEKTVDLTAVAARVTKAADGLVLDADLSSQVKGLTFQRSIRMDSDESGFRVTDTFRNTGSSPLRLGLETRGHVKETPWRVALLSGVGDEKRALTRAGGFSAGSRIFWRVAGPYGTGFLAQVAGPTPLTVSHELPNKGGLGSRFQARTGVVLLEPGQSTTLRTNVLIDDGAREARPSEASALAGSDRVLVTADLRAAGVSGEPLFGTATIVSAVLRKVTVSAGPWAQAHLELEPGKAKVWPFEISPREPGVLEVEVRVLDRDRTPLATSRVSSVIDGAGMGGEAGEVWKTYTRRMPEEVYRGTWATIGSQLARAGKLRPRDANPQAGRRLAFYEKHFPYYAELLAGAARELKADPSRLALAPAAAEGTAEGCMDLFFDGPDGPINAFSKERGGPSLAGLSYLKMLPAKGYRYHLYVMPPGSWGHGYGINSEGLATSGATINCDDATTRKGRQVTAAWKAAGKFVAPVGMHMLLAGCKDVDEAVAFIENPEAPLEFEGNMLLVDRKGKAARLESVGIFRQITRFDPKNGRCFVAGNYANPRADGYFKPGRWDWAANTMLRERFLADVLGVKPGRVSLRDVFRIMETHAAGGMCQHVAENPGRLYTSASFIAVCRTGELWLAHGPPCQVRYHRYTLD